MPVSSGRQLSLGMFVVLPCAFNLKVMNLSLLWGNFRDFVFLITPPLLVLLYVPDLLGELLGLDGSIFLCIYLSGSTASGAFQKKCLSTFRPMLTCRFYFRMWGVFRLLVSPGLYMGVIAWRVDPYMHMTIFCDHFHTSFQPTQTTLISHIK